MNDKEIELLAKIEALERATKECYAQLEEARKPKPVEIKDGDYGYLLTPNCKRLFLRWPDKNELVAVDPQGWIIGQGEELTKFLDKYTITGNIFRDGWEKK